MKTDEHPKPADTTGPQQGRPILSGIHSLREPAMLELVLTLLNQGKKVHIQVSGRSMQPFLQGSETVELTAVRTTALRRGDLVLHLDRQNTPLLHRLIRFRTSNRQLYLQTKGDNCPSFDAPVPADRIIARVQAVYGTANAVTGRKTLDMDLRRPLPRFRAYGMALRVLCQHYAARCCHREK